MYKGIKSFKGYQPRNNIQKDENGDLLADFLNIFNRLNDYITQFLNVLMVCDIKQRKVLYI
jgi:hypothetical protein